ncbi:hypothetical protein EQM14_04830 [Caproiciproducens sp. NJN-50]|uniref:type III toxin-antitoxin system CptIN family toxin n=1 Tax=Caproiciproducens sp. NJN-50 TaxID=2507162 RepID=UPI000FFE2315|nr:hypothetical protein [Caproiciproducens sp. NJN-50]QAT49153.1 hypothetical protein EQM14_04830 [Caproiciproducens sp. NJN-50]
MLIETGHLYFVSDDFFRKVNDPFLKINYEKTKRPHYFAFHDTEIDLFWLVPCSSKVEKFEKIIEYKQSQHKPTDTIRIVKIQDKKTVLLFQDMFPTTKAYIVEPYIRGNQPVRIADPKLIESLEKTAKKVIRLLRLGIKFTPTQPNVIRIEKLMLDELQNQTEHAKTLTERLRTAEQKAMDANRQQGSRDREDSKER